MSASVAAPEGVGIEVAEQFADATQQRHAAQLGMWAWLLTELLLFAGLFLCAAVLHVTHPVAVARAARHLKVWIGAANTAVLICSSLTMTGAITASRHGWRRWMLRCLLATAALGTLFLLLKGFEYYQDYLEHMTPFLDRPYALAGEPATRLYIDLYFLTTALHALHLTTGVAILLGMTWIARGQRFLHRHQNWIEVYGLYWHFIDLIWIMVFTLIYVVPR